MQVRLIGYCVEDSLFLVYEYIENGNLSQHLHSSSENDNASAYWTSHFYQCRFMTALLYLWFSGRDPLPWSTRVNIALDSARGLEYIHEYTVPVYIHCDIKPANILIDKNFRGKVCLFWRCSTDITIIILNFFGNRLQILG